MSKDIFVVIEQRNGVVQKVSYELIGEATKLAADMGEQVVAVLMGYQIADKAEMLLQYGASKVLVLDDPVLEHYTTEPYVKGLAHVLRPMTLMWCSSVPAVSVAIWLRVLPVVFTLD